MDPEYEEEQNYEEDEYQEDANDYDYGDDMDVQDMGLEKRKSSQNSQYNVNDLAQKIISETKQIDGYTAFGHQWSMLYYHACGWKKQLCQQLMGVDQKHKKLIHYTPDFFKGHGLVGNGDCMLCCQQNRPILQNLCGEQFCEDCWKNQLEERLRTYYTDPFPPCINDSCQVKISPRICFYLSDKYPSLKKIFTGTICRSYATYNQFVKICKGKPGIQCSRCFAINKMLDAIECDTCGSVICPRCGEQAHGIAQCFDLTNWRKVTEDSTQFVQMYNYKICPNCKEAVERRSGCNSIICPCKQQFCFICGQKWFPNHSAHGDQSCPKFKQIQALKEQEKEKKEKGKEYFLKIEAVKSEIESLVNTYKHVLQFQKNLKDYIKVFLQHWPIYESELTFITQICSFVKKSILFAKGWQLSIHFRPHELHEYRCKMLVTLIGEASDFLFNFVEKFAKMYATSKQEWTYYTKEQYLKEGMEEELTKKLKDFRLKMKNVTQSAANLMITE